MAKNRDELIAEYAHLNEPTHDLGTSQQEQRLDAATKAALDQAMGLTAGTTGAVGSLGTPNDRLIASMNEQRSRGGLAANQDYMKVGVPLGVLAATAGGGIEASRTMTSGTPAATPNTYTTSDGYTFRKVGNVWTDGDMRFTDKNFQQLMLEDAVDQFRGTSHDQARKDWHRNQALKAQQRRIAGFGSAAQTEAARAAKQAKSEALRSTTRVPYRQPGSGITDAGPLVQPNEERPLWQQREKLMAEYRSLQNLPPDHPDRTSYRNVVQRPGVGGHRRVTKLQDVVTKIQAIEAEIARLRNIGTLSKGPKGGRALGLGTGIENFGNLGWYPSGTQEEWWRARNVSAGDADVAFRQDIERKLNAMRRYFNQSAIARELSKVARVPAMAGQVSRAIPAGQAVALIAEPLMAFMSVFDDPTEGIFGISFGTQLKSMAATLTKLTGKPTPLQPRHLEPEAIQRLRAEPETAQDLYNFGALSEELWQEVKPRTRAPVSGEGP